MATSFNTKDFSILQDSDNGNACICKPPPSLVR